MEWYYAQNNQQLGPVPEAEFNRLATTGVIRPETLVWRDGMSEWQPYGKLFPQRRLAETDSTATGTPQPTAAAGDTLPSGDLEAVWQHVKQQGYPISVASCLSGGSAVAMSNYLPMLGTGLLYFLLVGVVQNIPILGLLAAILVVPQLTAGAWLYFVKHNRGEDVTVSALFDGFRKGYGQLALLAILQFLIIIPFMIVMFVVFFGAGIKEGAGMESDFTMDMVVFTPIIIAGLVLAYIYVRWLFAHVLVIDRGLTAIDALRMSWRMVGMRFWIILALLIIVGLAFMLGAIALFIGAVLVGPFCASILAKTYTDAFTPAQHEETFRRELS